MRPKLIIIYWRYYEFDGTARFLGGIETYLFHLTKVANNQGFETLIYQCAVKEFIIKEDYCTITGIKTPDVKVDKVYNLKFILNRIIRTLNKEKDIVLFGNYSWSMNLKDFITISIQHGVAWDLPISFLTQKKYLTKGLGEKVKRYTLRHNALFNFRQAKYKICVDYNFLNWYRTYYDSDDCIVVIPNCTEIIPEQKIISKIENIHKEKIIKILFARRFETFRGSRMIIPIIHKLLIKYHNIEFTIAGSGSDENLLRNEFNNNDRVVIIKYNAESASKIAYEHDISLIPSMGSEGTSFSVAEALGSGCAVIASDTGGITNMIINNFNGILIRPNGEELLNAISYLVDSPNQRERIIKNGYETAVNAFSREIWEVKWAEFLNKIKNLNIHMNN